MSVLQPIAEAATSPRTATTANARKGEARLHDAIQALLLALLLRLLGLHGAALRRALRTLPARSPWVVGPESRTNSLLRLVARLIRAAEPDAPIPRPLRRGSPDIIIALAHMRPPRNRARPARTRPLRPRQARDPPPPKARETAPSGGRRPAPKKLR